VLFRRFTLYRYRETVENLIVLLARVQKHASKSSTAEADSSEEEKEDPSSESNNPNNPDKAFGKKSQKSFKKPRSHPLRKALAVNPIVISPDIIKFAKPREDRLLSARGKIQAELPPPVPTSIPSKRLTKKKKEGTGTSSSSRESQWNSLLVQTALSKPTLPRQLSDALDSRVFCVCFAFARCNFSDACCGIPVFR